MKRFKKYYTKLLEGGRAVSNVSSIAQKDILPTVNNLKEDVFYPIGLDKDESDWALLGSAGKKETDSKDIDVGILTDKSAFDKIISIAEEKGLEHNLLSGFDILSIAYPINGTNSLVQVDLIPTDNMDYTKFIYWSPNATDTAYSKPGLYRTEFLKSVAREIQKEITETFDDGEPKTIRSWILDPRTGLMQAEDTYESPKTGNRVTGKQKISRDLITSDVNEILVKLLGEGATLDDVNSLETINDRINHADFPYPDQVESIQDYFLNVINRKNEANTNKGRGLLEVPKFK